MSRSFSEVAEDALNLSPDEQFKLARTLLERAEASGQPDIQASWDVEIERRIRNIDQGLAKGRSFKDVLRDVDRSFQK